MRPALTLVLVLASCGAGTPPPQPPRPAPRPSPPRIVELAAGRFHTCARADDGRVFCWGSGAAGQLGAGSGTDSPRPVSISSDAVGLSAGDFRTCLRLSAGSDRCFGLGAATATPRDEARGFRHSCALREGRVFCRGNGSFGQLGNGANQSSEEAVEVRGLAEVVSIAAGFVHTCAATASGEVLCWGGNAFGQLGDGTVERRSSPVRAAVAGPSEDP